MNYPEDFLENTGFKCSEGLSEAGKRLFKIGYFETRVIGEYHKEIYIDISDYPELKGKTDDEIIEYITDNSSKMKPQDRLYDSLRDQLVDQDIVKEKDCVTDSSVLVEVYREM